MTEPTPHQSPTLTLPARLVPFEWAFLILLWIHPNNRILTGLTVLTAVCVCCLMVRLQRKSIGRFRWLTRTIHVAAICSLIVAILPCKPFLSGPVYDVPDLSRPDIFAHRRIMVIAPHQDDELILLCGVLEEYIRHGSEVHIAFLTNGDFYGMGPKRINEALRVLTALGINREHIVFLGYGDQWKTP
ncbi:MAG: PIG-L family deacetylase, partial [Planctomycetia bacterium]|nr:PIG-L family deacetylase [Planctomycetia bacterium]